jgi:hypothetical protein
VNPHHFLFTKSDEQFDQIVADPVRRRTAIADRSKIRAFFFWCAGLLTLLSGASSVEGGKPPVGPFFFSAFFWIFYFKSESELRLLRAIERLYQDKESKTAAR